MHKKYFTIPKQRYLQDNRELGLSVRKIATLLGYKNHLALNTYINKRI